MNKELSVLGIFSYQRAWIGASGGGGYLDNSKHFIFWLCNMNQLNFRHFNINGKKFFETVFFSRKEQKRLKKGQ